MGQQEGRSTQPKRRSEDLARVHKGRVEGPSAHLLVGDHFPPHIEDEHPKGLHLEASQLGREHAEGILGAADVRTSVGAGPLHFSTEFEHRRESQRLWPGQSALRGQIPGPEPRHPRQPQIGNRPGQRSPPTLGEPAPGRPRRQGGLPRCGRAQLEPQLETQLEGRLKTPLESRLSALPRAPPRVSPCSCPCSCPCDPH